MDPIEKAIRNALEKGEILNPAFRQRVYASAEHALSRSLAAHATMSSADKQARIAKLRRIASQIEQDFTPATESIEPVLRAQIEPDWNPAPEPERHSTPESQRFQSPKGKKNTRGPVEDLAGFSAKSNRRLSRLFIFITFFALAVMLGWLFWTSGILDKKASGSANPTPDVIAESSGDDAAPKLGAVSDLDEGWISVFAASDAASLELAGGLSAELKGTGPDAYVLLTLPDNQSGKSAASIEVGKGLLENLRGKKIVFDIKSKAADASGAQMSVACDLAGMGECQRTRFRLENQLNDNLVSVQLKDEAPEASGILSISPDIEGKGRPIELHSVRVRVDE